MGQCSSKKKAATAVVDEEHVLDEIERSFHSSKKTNTKRQKLARHYEGVDVTEVYDIVEIIGQGSMGEVTIVQKKHNALALLGDRIDPDTIRKMERSSSFTNEIPTDPSKKEDSTKRKYACKTVNATRMKADEMAEFINEINILSDLDHPNIVQLFEVFKNKRKFWIVQELCSGGDLSSRLPDSTEEDVVTVTEQILRGITYMHARNMCHRDIKLENIMYADMSPESEVKLIDFGLSNKFTKGQKMQKACGTIYTAAPELLLGGGSTEQTDIWSIGCIVWIMLVKTYPFLRVMNDLKDDIKVQKLKAAKFVFGVEWIRMKISDFGKQFVTECLKADPAERWSVSQALDFVHNKWMPHIDKGREEKGGSPSKPRRKRVRMKTSTLQGIQEFSNLGEFKKTVLMTIAYTMDKSSLTELKEIFTTLDLTSSGTIAIADLKQALNEMHSDKHLDDGTVEKLFRGIDLDSSGEIHYNEFLAAVVESQGLITMERLAEVFDKLDVDGKGYISKEDLKLTLGSDYSEDLVNSMIEEADFKKNGQVDYDEFLRLMFGDDPAAGMENVGSTALNEDIEMVQKLGSFRGAGHHQEEITAG